MTVYRRPSFLAAAAVVALALAGCSSGPKNLPAASAAMPTGADEVEEIAALLDRGERREAEKRIEKGLARDPMNASLMVLLQGIEGDAKADLGPKNYPYTVQPGETMAELAERFLGNRLKSYQLARYNGIEVPSDLAAGSELRIPGQLPRAAAEPRTSPPPSTPRTRPAAVALEPKPAPPARPTADPAAAQRARSAGLTALNQGKIPQALTLLRRAATLDPGNATIASDLARAERIARTVRSRR
ncbi:LysM domain-containing protein [Pelagerythrobacter sp.]|uniref:LysM peptidoglycan-binding domain-containing protein n=1 Tax=Pelagerythrobacter sp. TaxID=2800702 RepID=UPI0035AFC7AB